MNSSRQTFSIIEKAILVMALALSVAAIAVSVLGKKSRDGQRGEADEPAVSQIVVKDDAALSDDGDFPEDDWPVVLILDKTVKRVFGEAPLTGEDCISELNDICDNQVRSPGADGLHRNSYDLQKKFADEIFLSLDGVVRDTFALAVKELYDRIAFSEFCRSFYYIREFCYGTDYPLPGEIKPSEATLAEAFPDAQFRKQAVRLLDLIYKKADFNKRFDYNFKKVQSYPFTYEMPFDTLRLGRALRNKDKYRDQSAFVLDIERYDNLDRDINIRRKVVAEIARRIEASVDFDTRCVYSLKIADILYDSEARGWASVLGSLIESREYSRFLIDAWDFWECRVQVDWFGCSNYSADPTTYFASIRAICANTTLRHIQAHPEDDDALLCLFRLIFAPRIEPGGLFGNNAAALLYELIQSGK